jgi:hypothetical protein
MIVGTRWFKRLYNECKRISPHIKFVRVRLGYFRIYWRGAYLHEVYSKMPEFGYDITDIDPRFENKSYYEEYEDSAELSQKIKNYVEGYHDSYDRILTRVYMMKNDREFNETATKAYRQFVVK